MVRTSLSRGGPINAESQTSLPTTLDSDRATARTASWFAWAVLIYMLGVILWGAYVRASGSGGMRESLASLQRGGDPGIADNTAAD